MEEHDRRDGERAQAVDVFFVISDYLINSIIAREVRAGRFSLLDFWGREANMRCPLRCIFSRLDN